jgi:polyhydroxybutyrate depolymerase
MSVAARVAVTVTVALIAAAAAACSGNGDDAGTADCGGVLSIEAAGRYRATIVHVPAHVDGERLPVVIGFHGLNSTAAEFAAYTELTEKADESGFIAVFPEGFGDPRAWHFDGLPSSTPRTEEQDLDFFDLLIERLTASPCVDPARIFVTGHSRGGGMASSMACQRSERLAGVALVAAQHYTLPCRTGRPIRVISIHAVDDPILPYFGGSPGGGGSGGAHVLPVETVVAGWAAEDGCTPSPRSEELVGGIVRLTWEGCAAPVVHYRLPVGGHAWPGCAGGTGYSECADADISATDVLWEFFSEQQ